MACTDVAEKPRSANSRSAALSSSSGMSRSPRGRPIGRRGGLVTSVIVRDWRPLCLPGCGGFDLCAKRDQEAVEAGLGGKHHAYRQVIAIPIEGETGRRLAAHVVAGSVGRVLQLPLV